MAGLRGLETVCGEFEGGGAKYFLSGPKVPPRIPLGTKLLHTALLSKVFYRVNA